MLESRIIKKLYYFQYLRFSLFTKIEKVKGKPYKLG